MLYYSGRVVKLDQTKLGSTKPNTSGISRTEHNLEMWKGIETPFTLISMGPPNSYSMLVEKHITIEDT